MLFDELIGNNKAKETLEKTIQNKHILHSYLFIGPEGIGKKQFAIRFSKAILCTEEDKPCGKCKSCIELEGNNNPDFELIESDGKIKIEQIRMMQNKIAEKPIISGRKVYLIDNSDTMTQEAQNCLLKTLEEPPEYITIILIASNENKILNTIKSRCSKVNFQKIDDVEIKEYISKNIPNLSVNDNMLKMYGGSVAKAINLQDKIDIYEKVEEVAKKLESKDLLEVFSESEVLYKEKEEIKNILEYMNLLFLEKIKEDSKRQNYLNAIRIVEKVKKNLEANSNYDMSIDKLLLEIWEEIN